MAADKKGRKLPQGIRRRANGRYEIRVKKDGKSHSVYADTLTEAKKKKAELTYKLEQGILVEKQKITLDTWFDTWIEEYKRNRVKVGTIIRYKEVYEDIIKNRYGSRQLSNIRGEHIQSLYNELNDKGYANATIKLVSAILNGCLQQAMRNGLIERNPVRLAEIPRETKKRKGRIAMTKDQQTLFMEYAKGSYLYNLFGIMLSTGVRCGEALGLIYSLDVDKKKNVLHVQRTLKYENLDANNVPEELRVKGQDYHGGSGFYIDKPKTGQSLRDIPLTDNIIRLLDNQRNYWGFKVEKFDRFLFCSEEGKPLNRIRVQAEINRIIKEIRAAGHDFPHITPHIFRHTFATRAVESGVKPEVLKEILGHSSISMTMDLYYHNMDDVKQEEMQKIAYAF